MVVQSADPPVARLLTADPDLLQVFAEIVS